MFAKVCLLLGLASIALVSANLYDGNADVISLTAANFQTKVMKSDQIWLVEFYAPWCGHCKQLTPEWVKAAKALKGVVKVGAVNMDGPDQSVGAPYGVKGFPTIKIFGADKNAPIDYQQGRDSASIAQAGIKAAVDLVQTRLGGGGGSSGGSSKVVELTDSNFEKKVMQSKDPWLVAFVAPWCGHCKALTPNWESAANDMDGKAVHLARVDATAQQGLAQKFGVKGFPTIKLFKDGKDQDYQGGRDKSDIVQYLENLLEASLPPPEVKQLVSESVFTDNCANKQLCLVAFFPGMVDSSAKDRNDFIGVLKGLTEKRTLKSYGFVWAEAGQQPELEKAFNLPDQYPALAAINAKKLGYATMRGAFTGEEISGFIGRMQREARKLDSGKLPAIKDAQEWDGKDVEVAQEEEMSLDDIMNESLDEV